MKRELMHQAPLIHRSWVGPHPTLSNLDTLALDAAGLIIRTPADESLGFRVFVGRCVDSSGSTDNKRRVE